MLTIAHALAEVRDRIATMESKYNGGIPAFLYHFIYNSDMRVWRSDAWTALTPEELEEVRGMGFIVLEADEDHQVITLPGGSITDAYFLTRGLVREFAKGICIDAFPHLDAQFRWEAWVPTPEGAQPSENREIRLYKGKPYRLSHWGSEKQCEDLVSSNE